MLVDLGKLEKKFFFEVSKKSLDLKECIFTLEITIECRKIVKPQLKTCIWHLDEQGCQRAGSRFEGC